MKVVFSSRSWQELQDWLADDSKISDRLIVLINDARRSPFVGIGKPEPLRQNWSGWWSRRIDGEHRLVYRITGSHDQQAIEIAQCRYHYGR